MIHKIASVACIVASSTLALAVCYEMLYVDEACQMNRCPDPINSCSGNPVWINNAPVYTTNQVAEGHKREVTDYLCRIEWFTMDNLGNCVVSNTCDRWTGGFKSSGLCKQQLG